MQRPDILRWLGETDPRRLERLWRAADAVRAEHVGDAVHLRALIEISSHCAGHCHYCGLRADNRCLPRYRMSEAETMDCVIQAARLGLGTVVLQAGEDPGLTRDAITALIRRIQCETPLAVTLSLGERDPAELAAWRDAGADRYLLRFETSNPNLYARLHPARPGQASDRIAMLQTMREIGYEVGSGAMIGLPGQCFEDLADDLLRFRELDLDMIGVGPYIPHPHTPLARLTTAVATPGQAPRDELTTYKVVALTRLLCPDANIPSTTALAALNPSQGRQLALQRGANIVMPNFTPPRYRALYEVYPGKACVHEEVETCLRGLRRRIESIGRTVGAGRGDAPRFRLRRPNPVLRTGRSVP